MGLFPFFMAFCGTHVMALAQDKLISKILLTPRLLSTFFFYAELEMYNVVMFKLSNLCTPSYSLCHTCRTTIEDRVFMVQLADHHFSNSCHIVVQVSTLMMKLMLKELCLKAQFLIATLNIPLLSVMYLKMGI